MIPKPSKPHWSGPFVGGITQSLITRFLECPFRFYLYAYCGFREPEPQQQQLIWGSVMHIGLEHLIRGHTLTESNDMMRHEFHTNYLDAPPSFIHSTCRMLGVYKKTVLPKLQLPAETEIEINELIPIPGVDQLVRFRGKRDVLNNRLGDHKCKGRIYAQETLTEISTDLQMNLYDYFSQKEYWFYDLIQIPEFAYRVPDRLASQSPQKWVDYIFDTHSNTMNGFPITQFPHQHCVHLTHFQPIQETLDYFDKTIIPIVKRIIRWWDHVNDPSFDPNKASCYNDVFYISPLRLFDPSRTDKFKPHFHGLFTGQYGYEALTASAEFYAELSHDESDHS